MNFSLDKINLQKTTFANIKLKEFSFCYNDLENETTGSVNLEKVVGTSHPDYYNKTWGELLNLLYNNSPRSKSNREMLSNNYKYYLDKEEKDTWTFVEKNGEYYIIEGNHRTIIGRFFLNLNNLSQIVHGVKIYQFKR